MALNPINRLAPLLQEIYTYYKWLNGSGVRTVVLPSILGHLEHPGTFWDIHERITSDAADAPMHIDNS